MGKLVVVVGSTGIGKTTLTRLLCQNLDLVPGLEDHAGRPFQSLFLVDSRYALPNQLDYLLFRMEQESAIRKSHNNGILDGGLEMDFHGFTRLFHTRGLLSDSDLDLCHQLYSLARTLLPPPDLVIHMTARAEIISHRLLARDRINIATSEDTLLLDAFLQEWIDSLYCDRLITLDVSDENPEYTRVLPGLLAAIHRNLS